MIAKVSRYAGKWRRQRRLNGRERYVREYLAENPRLAQVIAAARSASSSTGADSGDYVVLHSLIRRRKPNFVLECGTGITTWIMAEALLENLREAPESRPKLISMEHHQTWHEHAVTIFPADYAGVAEIYHSPICWTSYSLLQGSVYERIPDYPFDFVFVDGPDQERLLPDGSSEVLCNLDFVRLVERSAKPITALIDNRRHTVMAYTLIFGQDKVQFYDDWDLGLVAGVTRDDLLLNDKRLVNKRVFYDVVSSRYGPPSL